ncbi:MAG: hypothetical protein LQ347_004029 [Umbilicaria vellea]|nr:MAG: hypothetical protein LQ347_004029 [Umbilicaria vellea]
MSLSTSLITSRDFRPGGAGEDLTSQQDAWAIAREQYLDAAGLTPAEHAEQQRFLSSSSPDEVIKQLQSLETQHGENSRSRSSLARLQPLIDWLARFGSALDVFANADPHGVLSLVWGSLRILLVLAKDFQQWFEDVVLFLEQIQAVFHRLEAYEKLFVHSLSLRTALSKVYLELLDFVNATAGVLRKEKGSRMGRVGIKVFKETLWKDHSATFGRRISQMKHLCDETERDAALESRSATAHFQDEIRKSMGSQESENRLRKVLAWLSPIATHDDYERIRRNSYPGSCEWILQVPEILDWLNPASSYRLLWVHGIPGSGKTHASSFFIEHLQKSHVVAYFFCDTKDDRKRDLLGILSALASQLLEQQTHQLEEAARLCDRGLSPNVTDVSKALRCLVAPSGDVRHFLVLDGLDECDARVRKELLGFLGSLLPYAKVLIVSRDELDIRAGVSLAATSTELVTFKITADNNGSDINRMILEEVSKLGLDDNKLKEQIAQRLNHGACGMFLWVRLMIEQLSQQTTHEEVEEALQDLPNGLNETYGRILLRIQDEKKSRRVTAEKILKWVVCAIRPLTVTELATGLAIAPGEKTFNPKKRVINPSKIMLDLCAPLVELDESTQCLKIVHASVRDFLLNFNQPTAPGAFLFDRVATQHFITQVCLTYLSYDRPSVNVTSDIDGSIKNLEHHCQSNLFLEYSCLNWWQHAHYALGFELRGLCDAISTLVTSEVRTVKWLQLLHYLQGKQTAGFKLGNDRSSKLQVERIREELGQLVSKIHASLVHDGGFPELATWFSHLGARPWEGFTCNDVSVYAYPLFHVAACFNYLSVIQQEVNSGVSIDELDHVGQTPLIAAARGEAVQAAEFLLQNGANINHQTTSTHVSALDEVFQGRCSFKLLPILLQFRPNLELARWGCGTKAIHRITHAFTVNEAETIAAIRKLRDHGVDLESRATDNVTPLHKAVMSGMPRLVQVLLDNGASPNGSSQHLEHGWQTPLHTACEFSQPSSCCAPVLIAAGAELSPVNEIGETPLHRAALTNSDLVQLLVRSGADINAQTDRGYSPLHYAVERANLAAFTVLVNAGCRLDLTTRRGQTPLTLAIETQFSSAVEILLNAGVDVHGVAAALDTARPWAELQSWWPRLDIAAGTGALMEAT